MLCLLFSSLMAPLGRDLEGEALPCCVSPGPWGGPWAQGTGTVPPKFANPGLREAKTVVSMWLTVSTLGEAEPARCGI